MLWDILQVIKRIVHARAKLAQSNVGECVVAGQMLVGIYTGAYKAAC